METENRTMNSIHFDSIQDIIDYDLRNIPNNYNKNNFLQCKSRRLDEKSVVTARSSEQCLIKAFDGDHELYENYCKNKLHEIDQNINVNDYLHLTAANKRKRYKTDHGNELDIHKVYQGKIDRAWDNTKKVVDDQRIKFVTVFADIGENWRVDGMHSIWNCAVLLKLCDIIELSGKNVQLIVGGTASGANYKTQYTSVSCTIKRYNERLSPERLAAMSHLGFYRSFCFMADYTSKYECKEGLGRHTTIYDKLLPLHLQEEIALGHTKAIIVKGSLNCSQAVDRLKLSFEQLKNVA